MTDDYTIVPFKEIEQIEKDVSDIKENPLIASSHSKELAESMEQLRTTLNDVLLLFSQAAKDPNVQASNEQYVAARLDKLTDTVQAMGETIIALSGNVDHVKKRVDTIFSQVTLLKAREDALQKSEMDANVHALPEQLSTLATPLPPMPPAITDYNIPIPTFTTSATNQANNMPVDDFPLASLASEVAQASSLPPPVNPTSHETQMPMPPPPYPGYLPPTAAQLPPVNEQPVIPKPIPAAPSPVQMQNPSPSQATTSSAPMQRPPSRRNFGDFFGGKKQ